MTTTAIATKTTHADEQATTGRETRKNRRPAAQTDARPETGTAYLPSATSGANTTNWK